jgi:nucleoside-diphosphate-sugar epimerase
MKALPARWLITGGGGFLGRHLISALGDRGCSIRSYSLDPPKNMEDLAERGVDIRHGDILDQPALREALGGVDVVVHMAGEKRNPERFNLINQEGTRRVLTVCQEAGIPHVIHISSAGVIGIPAGDLVTEETECRPRNDYEVSKFEAEKTALEFHRRRGLPVTVLRPANVFGDLDPERHLLTLMRQVQKGRFRLIGRKEAWLNYVYAGDVADACLLMSQDLGTAGQVYGLSDPCPMTEFITEVSKILGIDPRLRRIPLFLAIGIAIGFKAASTVLRRPSPLSLEKIKSFRSRAIYNPDKLKKAFPSWPRFGWREGLKRTIAWYRAQGWLS